ncbi:MAG: hypothetical protein ABIB71_01060 [Candidatus Woesearchaeota archaeon]
MNDKKYRSTIKFKKDLLEISISYERAITREDMESYLDYYQWRFSQKTGKPVPREEIIVSPKAGELIEEATLFIVTVGHPLYVGLSFVHQRAPYVLPKLIEDLRQYREKYVLQENQEELIQHTVGGLEGIIEAGGSKS